MRDLQEDEESIDLAEKLRMMEEWRWHKFYKAVFPILIACVIIFVAINFMTGKTFLAVLELAVLPFFVLPYVLVLINRQQNIVKAILVAGMMAVMCLPLLPSMHLTAWYSMPVTVVAALFLVLGRKRSALIILIPVLVLNVAFFFRYTIADAPPPLGAQINFYVMILFMTFISYFNESTKAQYQAALNEAAAQLEKQSNMDSLTRLFNRRYLDRRIRIEWNRHSRSEKPLSLILCDIDFFKEINDSAGHPAGDDCLKTVAAVIRKSAARDTDVPARFGGDEFAILLPESDAEAALIVANRLRESLTEKKRPHPAFESRLVSLSIGVCTMNPSKSNRPEKFIAAADRGMYRSKIDGRDRISVESVDGYPFPD